MKDLMDRLNRLYEVSETALKPEILEGYLVSVILCPKMLPPSIWLPRVFGEDDEVPEFPDRKTAEEAIGALLEFYHLIAMAVKDKIYEPFRNENEPDPLQQILNWRLGFALGLLRHLEEWKALLADQLERFGWPAVVLYSVDPEADFAGPASGEDIARLDAFVHSLPERLPSLIYELYEHNQSSAAARFSNGEPKISRNAPCPCGSGKKYKNCCWLKGRNPAQEKNRETIDSFAEQQFNSFEEAQAFAKAEMRRKNETPLEDFHGLSPEQMMRLLHFPFSSPELVAFSARTDLSVVPIMRLFMLLIDAIDPQKGLKPTSTGNLPRTAARQIAKLYLGEEGYAEFSRYGEIRSETDYQPLHISRLVFEMAGLVRKYRGRFIRSRLCRQWLDPLNLPAIYDRIFKTYTAEFNWAFGDYFPEIPILQQSFLFTLYLLQRYGKKWRSEEFYQDAFLTAFPTALQGIETEINLTPVEVIRLSYTRRCLNNFTQFLGLSEIRPAPTADNKYAIEIRGTAHLWDYLEIKL